ncbi:MAG: acetate/propionate family kinase [Rhizobiaceae bacterium]|nr:acetate/propionate family kinase [Rhizobiaceae bacterium]
MRILVFNAGSSSVKFGVFEEREGPNHLLKATYERFDRGGCTYRLEVRGKRLEGRRPLGSVAAAVAGVPAILDEHGLSDVDAIGHRVAHGGERFTAPVRIDDGVVGAIEALVPLAPLHNPVALDVMRATRVLWPALAHVAVFDTAFHLTNPPRATTYAVPRAWRDAGLRRFGFHGTSHKYVAERAADALGEPLRELKLVSLHLGNGASACAVQLGRSIDSSMGMTPLEGLVMGTRSGDVDPGMFGFLDRSMGLTIQEIEKVLYEESGLKALAGSSDMRDIEDQAAAGDDAARQAIELYAYRARKYVGAYAAAMGGLDVLVFTGGIGENSSSMRRRICDGLGFLGLQIDADRNAAVRLEHYVAPQIQAYGSRVRVLVTETAEQLMIAKEVVRLLRRPEPVDVRIPVAVSARHVHLDRSAVAALFGEGYELTPASALRQPGHWLAEERLTLEGPKGRLERVAILGPLRDRVQVEISRTDGFALGIEAPVRDSGKLDGTPRIGLVGPAGTIDTDGVIVAARHVHTNPADAVRYGLSDGDEIEIRLGNGDREASFGATLVRVSAGAVTEMHIDTDEANAAGLDGAAEGQIVASAKAILRS